MLQILQVMQAAQVNGNYQGGGNQDGDRYCHRNRKTPDNESFPRAEKFK